MPKKTSATPDFPLLRERALAHLRALSEDIGPRPPTSVNQKRAVLYVAEILRNAGIENLDFQSFRAGKHTYWPYVAAFAAGLVGNLAHLLHPRRATSVLAALLNASGAWAFFAQTDFEDNWARRLFPKGTGLNLIARIPARRETRRRIVLSAHLDTHKTPWVYRSPHSLRAFSLIVGGSFLSLLVGAILHILRAVFGWPRSRWLVGGLPLALQAVATGMAVEGETTPYTHGANDNASGAAVILALAEHLAQHPLPHTEVWVVFTDCEEVGAYGMDAFLRQYGPELRDADFLNVDMVGLGIPGLQSVDGLLRRHPPHPEIWAKAVEVVQRHPQWRIKPWVGAYTDATVATKRGFKALTITMVLPPEHPAARYGGYWHQPQDRWENIEPETLESAIHLVWALMERLSQEGAGPSS